MKRHGFSIAMLLVLSLSSLPAIAGSFSLMTYNVRGLPPQLIEDRAAQMTAIAPLLEDFHTSGGQYDGVAGIVLVQELFYQSYYDTITDSQTVSFPFITEKDNTPGLFNVPLGNGLNRLSDIAFSGHTRTKWNSCFGSNGAAGSDCDAPKGFDYAHHEVAPGVFIDIYDLHADAGQDEGSRAARRDNISQLIAAINENAPEGTAVIVTGDTNSLYTRSPNDAIETILSGTGVKDVWVELVHGGVVPSPGPKIETGCDTDPGGADCELIDKVFYRSGVDVTLTPTSYAALQTLFQDDLGQDLSDHIPVAVTFDYEVNGGTTTTTISSITTTTVSVTTTTISGPTTTTVSSTTTTTIPGNPALVGRLPATPGGSDYQAYYDPALDITWLADANLASSNTFGVGPINDGTTSNPGAMGFSVAIEYVAAVNAAKYLGFSTWRLPTVAPIDGVSFDFIQQNDGTSDRGYNIGAPGTEFAGSTASALAHLYYTTLGNLGFYDTSGAQNPCAVEYPFCLTETGPFSNVMGLTYWIGTPYDPNPGAAWAFNFGRGEQNAYGMRVGSHVWLVLDGDVDSVGVCGDANADTRITAADALSALRTAVTLQTCAFCRCDTDNSGQVTASDALAILRYAVEQPVTFKCPACS